MFILENPYVSDFLIETIKKNKFSVLDNEIARNYFAIDELISKYDNTPVYSNSENSISWVENNLPQNDISKMIKVSKNKILFREVLSEIYPDYYFKKVKLEDIKTLDKKTFKYPFILKPAVGFLSFGVYPVENENDWNDVITKLDNDIKNLEGIFPKSVVDMSEFIIEEMISGDEFALDAYFDKNGEAVILNIFHHPFFNGKDVSDRLYYTSKEIIEKYLEKFKAVLDKTGKCAGYKNFPFHLELRADGDKIIPIELNPMRFCGWCITDIAKNAWGINVYECFMKNIKPDWQEILKKSDDSIYYFTIGDIPSSLDRTKIKIDYEKYLSNISNPLVVRKIDYIANPVFAIVFAKTNSKDEINHILNLNMKDFIIETK